MHSLDNSTAFLKESDPSFELPQWKWIPDKVTPNSLIYLNLSSASSREQRVSPNFSEKTVANFSLLSSSIDILHKILIFGAILLILSNSSYVSAVHKVILLSLAHSISWSYLTEFDNTTFEKSVTPNSFKVNISFLLATSKPMFG